MLYTAKATATLCGLTHTPVCCTAHGQDNLVRTSNSDKIAKLLGVDCVVIPDTGHGLIEEAAGTVCPAPGANRPSAPPLN